MQNHLRLALAQISPVWLDQKRTIAKVKETIHTAAENNAELLVFGEGFLPGYPFWLAYTEGASWELKIRTGGVIVCIALWYSSAMRVK